MSTINIVIFGIIIASIFTVFFFVFIAYKFYAISILAINKLREDRLYYLFLSKNDGLIVFDSNNSVHVGLADHILVDERFDWKSQQIHTFECGHTGPTWFYAHVYGLPGDRIDNIDECPSCYVKRLKDQVARCAICGLPIFPGNDVVLYQGDHHKIRYDIATIVNNKVMGCLRINCCPPFTPLAGSWTLGGFEPASSVWPEK